MSMRVVGFRPPDEKWRKMYAVWKACVEAGIEPPDEAHEFFGWSDPEPEGVEVDVPYSESENGASASCNVDVDVNLIPKGVRVLRFRISF